MNNIAIIVNKANNTYNLTSSKLARIYKGIKEKWQDGQRITAINRPVNTDIRRQFYKTILGESPTRKFFKPGLPIPFKTMRVKSDSATRKFVARIPNVIGYIRLSEVDDAVKVLKIDERFSWEAEYQMHFPLSSHKK